MDKVQYHDAREADPFIQGLADIGLQVSELAKLHFPGGRDCTERGHDEAVLQTERWLNDGEAVIFEAALKAGHKFIRVDILELMPDEIRIIEVNAKGFDGDDSTQFFGRRGGIQGGWRPYIEDITFQVEVARAHFEALGDRRPVRGYLMGPNKNAEATYSGLHQHFQIVYLKGLPDCVVRPGTTLANIGEGLMATVDVQPAIDHILEDSETYDLPDWACSDFRSAIRWFEELHLKQEEDIALPMVAPTWNCRDCPYHTPHEQPKDGKVSGRRRCFEHHLGWTDVEFSAPKVWDVYRAKSEWVKEGKWLVSDLTFDEADSVLNKNASVSHGLSTVERQEIQIKNAKNNVYDAGGRSGGHFLSNRALQLKGLEASEIEAAWKSYAQIKDGKFRPKFSYGHLVQSDVRLAQQFGSPLLLRKFLEIFHNRSISQKPQGMADVWEIWWEDLRRNSDREAEFIVALSQVLREKNQHTISLDDLYDAGTLFRDQLKDTRVDSPYNVLVESGVLSESFEEGVLHVGFTMEATMYYLWGMLASSENWTAERVKEELPVMRESLQYMLRMQVADGDLQLLCDCIDSDGIDNDFVSHALAQAIILLPVEKVFESLFKEITENDWVVLCESLAIVSRGYSDTVQNILPELFEISVENFPNSAGLVRLLSGHFTGEQNRKIVNLCSSLLGKRIVFKKGVSLCHVVDVCSSSDLEKFELLTAAKNGFVGKGEMVDNVQYGLLMSKCLSSLGRHEESGRWLDRCRVCVVAKDKVRDISDVDIEYDNRNIPTWLKRSVDASVPDERWFERFDEDEAINSDLYFEVLQRTAKNWFERGEFIMAIQEYDYCLERLKQVRGDRDSSVKDIEVVIQEIRAKAF